MPALPDGSRPAGTAPGQAEIAAALLDPSRPRPGGRNFSVHRNNVVAGLVKALATTFPAVRRLVGDAFFDVMAAKFVRARPPHSPVLLVWGAEFPDWLAAFPPAERVPYLADVARLEWSWVEAFNAEDAEPTPAARLHARPADGLEGLRLVPHPSLRLVRSPHPIVSLWADVTGRRPGAVDLAVAETALVVRPGGEVRVHTVAADHADFFEGLLAMLSLGDLADLAARQGLDLTAALAIAFGDGLVADIQ